MNIELRPRCGINEPPSFSGKELGLQPLEIRGRRQLIRILRQHNIPLDEWGKGLAKKPKHLFEEIRNGESQLFIDQNNELLREVQKVTINVEITRSGKRQRLFQESRARPSKKEEPTWIRRFPKWLNQKRGVMEKLKPSEDHLDTAKRALEEEHILDPKKECGFENLKYIKKRKEVRKSKGFPGLKTRYVLYRYNFELPQEQFRWIYYSKEGDQEIRFQWEEVKM